MTIEPIARLRDSLLELFPDQSFIWEELEDVIAGAPVLAHFVRPETVFDADSVYQRVITLVLTDERFFFLSVDANHEFNPEGELVTTIQSVPLGAIKEFQVIRRRELQGPNAGRINSFFLRMRWGGVFSADVVPGQCDDLNCTSDHGYMAMGQAEDFQLYVDRSGDADFIPVAEAFASALGRLVRGA